MYLFEGKFGQDGSKIHVEFVDNQERLEELFHDKTLTIHHMTLVGVDMMKISYSHKEEHTRLSTRHNFQVCRCTPSSILLEKMSCGISFRWLVL